MCNQSKTFYRNESPDELLSWYIDHMLKIELPCSSSMVELQYFHWYQSIFSLRRIVVLILHGEIYITAIVRFFFLIPYPCQSQQMESAEKDYLPRETRILLGQIIRKWEAGVARCWIMICTCIKVFR